MPLASGADAAGVEAARLLRISDEMKGFARPAMRGANPASIEITSFGLAEDLDRLKRLKELGVARVVPMFPSEKSDKVLPIIDRWAKLMKQVND
jgi:hypothetical protein